MTFATSVATAARLQPARAPGDARRAFLVVVVRREHPVKAGVADRHVVGLQVVVHRDLPVDVPLLVRHLGRRHHVLERYGASSLEAQVAHTAAVRRRWVPARQTKTKPSRTSTLDRLEAVRRAVKAGEAVARRHAEQAALVVVRPAVVRADDRAPGSGRCRRAAARRGAGRRCGRRGPAARGPAARRCCRGRGRR